eukprot:TRINITY_DN28478_c0_g1_i1.p1 TRINITY_DN28478_c0_g1~~TRINITY_DN28478_c0_g1_i1.p1  ORF type:complete len:475 (-),score=159.95 TRINITY_DN28478_c0_g1_i1:280-1704(-)
MGAIFSDSKWFSPDLKKKEGTALKELRIVHLRDAHEILNLEPEGYTPIVLIPESSVSRCCGLPLCWVGIPAGFNAIVTRCGKEIQGDREDGTFSEGFHWWCFWNRVSRLVSSQLIIFDAPCPQCKTADNINVDIDVLFVFEITDAVVFAHKLGPEKLDDLLRASQEEVLRSLVGEISIDDVYDLYGKATEKWVVKMNEQFSPFGVQIHHFTVRNVTIPDVMAQDMEDKTLYDSRTNEQLMLQEHQLEQQSHEEARAKLQEEKDNEKVAKEETSITAQEQLRKEVKEIRAKAESEIATKKAQMDAKIEDIVTTAALEQAQIESEIMRIKREVHASVDLDVGKLEMEAEQYELKRRATGKMESVEKISEGKKAVAEAEGTAASAFSARRLQEQELARLEILAKLAQNKHIKIASSMENATGLAPDNSLVAQVTQQGLEALRMKLAEMTAASASKLEFGKVVSGGLVRPMPQQQVMK